jgi:hypothetical protein
VTAKRTISKSANQNSGIESLASADQLADRIAHQAGAEPWRVPDPLLPQLLPRATALGAGWWNEWTCAAAADERRAICERLESANEGWRIGMVRRHAILRARAAAVDGRSIVIWGTGQGARLATELLGSFGLRPAAYAQSEVEPGRQFAGRPVLQPSALTRPGASRPFVVVAGSGPAEVTPALVALGLSADDDFVVLDGRTLTHVERRPAPTG